MSLDTRFVENLKDLEVGVGSRILIAYSGGGDSTALLLLFHRALVTCNFSITACHIEHGLRGEDSLETSHCQQLCHQLGIPMIHKQIPPGRVDEFSRTLGNGIEDSARTLRYEILEHVAIESECDVIATGHTEDDNIETHVMRLFSGSGPEGLRGIPVRRGKIIRPLLNIPGEALRSYLTLGGFSWVEDPTNTDDRFQRNRIRNDVLPALERSLPGFHKGLQALEEKALWLESALQESEDVLLPSKQEQNAVLWDIEQWNNAPQYLQARALWKAFDVIQSPNRSHRRAERLPWTTIKQILKYFDSADTWLGKGIEIKKDGAFLVFRKQETVRFSYCSFEKYDLVEPTGRQWCNHHFSVVVKILFKSETLSFGDSIFKIDQWPIILSMDHQRRRFLLSGPHGAISECDHLEMSADGCFDFDYILVNIQWERPNG